MLGVRALWRIGAANGAVWASLALAVIGVIGAAGWLVLNEPSQVRRGPHQAAIPSRATAGTETARRSLGRLPMALQAAASSAVGGAHRTFEAVQTTAGLQAVGGGLRTDFSRSGPIVHAGGAELGLRMVGVGAGDRLRPSVAADPVSVANRVFYRHAGVTEWYRNGPLGLEQGFTVDRRPGSRADWLTIAVRTSGGLIAHGSRTRVVFQGRAGGSSGLRYSGLHASDAAGHSLPTQFELRGDKILLRIDDRHARYPVAVDPMVEQGPKLTVAAGQELGWSVALSSDGNTALVGALDGNTTGAYVFTRSAGSWSQQAELSDTSSEGSSEYGFSVALSADGNTAVLGGPRDGTGNGYDPGAVLVYTRSGSTWTQQAKLVPGDESSAPGEPGDSYFGSSVALSSDGSTALIGGPRDWGNALDSSGAAWVYTRAGSTWTEQAKVTGDGEYDGAFGTSVALSADGSSAVIGEPSGGPALTGGGNAGAVWSFTRTGSTWSESQELGPSDANGRTDFGTSVALSDDGLTALIGGPFDNDGTGAVWAFRSSGSTWTQAGPKLTANDETQPGEFGTNVALSGDGSVALVGAWLDGNRSGAAWLFTSSGSSWAQQGPKTTASNEGGAASFGHGVALSDDGTTALVGGPTDNGYRGAAWVYQPNAPSITAPADGSYTNNAQPAVSGWAGMLPGEGSTVTVDLFAGSSDSGSPIESLTSNVRPDGSFSAPVQESLPDGTYTAQAQQSDQSGSVASPPNTFTVDTVPPTITLTAPADGSSSNQRQPSLSGVAGTAPDDLRSVTVDIYSGPSTSGTLVETLRTSVASDGTYWVFGYGGGYGLSDGTYTAQAEQSDSAGNVGKSSANTFTVDTVAPTVTLTGPADGSSTNQSQPSFSGVAGAQPGDSGSVTVEVYGGSTASGTPVQTLSAQAQSDGSYSISATSPLPDGTYTAQAEQSDSAGNLGQSPASTFTIDTPPPAVTLNSPANGAYINRSQPTFSGAAADQASDSGWVTVKVYPGSDTSGSAAETLTTQIQPDGSYSIQASSALADGTYTAQSQQADDAGNVGYSPSTTFTLDTHAPAVTVSIPASGSTDHYRSPSISGSAGTTPDDQPQVAIAVYGGTSATGSPVETLSATASAGQWAAQSSALSDGTYTITAQQSDLAGTISTATSTFTLDATPPNTSISSGPANPAESSDASFTFFSSEGGSTFECQLDAGNWTPCTSPASYSGLADGGHSFSVRATDPWGNTDPTGATATWTIDTSAPHTVISSAPPNPTQSSAATFVFFSNRPGSTFQCQLDSSSWRACSSPTTYSDISAGQHTFSVRATNQAGVTDSTPATASWTVGTFLLSTSSLHVISGIPSGKRIARPAIDLKTGIASVGTAFCSRSAKRGCALKLELTVPGLAATTALTADKPTGLSLGYVRATLRPGHHTKLTIHLGKGARGALRQHGQIRARATFILNGGRSLAHVIVLRVMRRAGAAESDFTRAPR
jgi:hypothetical protein